MTGRDLTAAHGKTGLGIALALGATFGLQICAVADTALEKSQLALLVRQLDAVERTAQQAAASASASGQSRYRFDYARLHADLARVRAGIEDYLTPSRAQPRDPGPLNGEYRTEGAAKP